MPVLLLDDVFSELDAERQAKLIKALSKCQSIVTAIDFPAQKTSSASVFKIENGAVVI